MKPIFMKPLLLILFLISTLLSFSQIGKPLSNEKIRGILKDPVANQDDLSALVIRNEFTRIALPNLNAGFGNYVGISTANDNLTFGYSFVNEKSVLELTAQGAVKDGVANIFSAQNLNNNASIGFNWNRFFKVGQISLEADQLSIIRKEDRKLMNEKKLHHVSIPDFKKLEDDLNKKEKEYQKAKKARLDLENTYGRPGTIINADLNQELLDSLEILITDSTLLRNQIDSFDTWKTDEIDILRTKRDASSNTNPSKEHQFKADSLDILGKEKKYRAALATKRKYIKEVNNAISKNKVDAKTYNDRFEKLKSIEELADTTRCVAAENLAEAKKWYGRDSSLKSRELDNKINTNLNKIYDLKAKNVQMIYTSLGGNLKNESFSLFDPTKAPSQQVSSISYFTPSLNFSVTYYESEDANDLKKHHIKFFTLGGSVTYGNNLSSLTQLDVINFDSVGTNTAIERRQKAFAGTFEDSIVTGQFFTDYYQFLGKFDNVGYHIKGTVDMVEKQSPVTSIRVGLIFAAIDRDNSKSRANFEVFYGWNDIFGNSSRGSLFSRNVIGIQTSFPFDFKAKQQK